MKSVYADSQLPYNQSTKFVFPKDFRECGDELGPIGYSGGHRGGGGGGGGGGHDDVVEGIFD